MFLTCVHSLKFNPVICQSIFDLKPEFIELNLLKKRKKKQHLIKHKAFFFLTPQKLNKHNISG